MDKGRDFLRAQVSNAVMQHKTLLENVEDHEQHAEDPRYRQLCSRYIPQLRQHQRMLEEYRATLGGESGSGVKEAIGTMLGKARDAVDAVREDDFLRVVGDVVTIRQSQDTFATFAATGDQIGEPRLAQIGRDCERDHDSMQRDFNTLAQAMFAERARAV
jgi:hypothetical protein